MEENNILIESYVALRRYYKLKTKLDNSFFQLQGVPVKYDFEYYGPRFSTVYNSILLKVQKSVKMAEFVKNGSLNISII